MTYELEFEPHALKEWKKLGESVKPPLKQKLSRRLEEPRNPKAALHNLPNCYKIKHGSYRLIYQVLDNEAIVRVLAVGTRERLAAYKAAEDRLDAE